jgi:predicted regulator of Ras-like GTPase activity (Roadblock/LC7/MglB family)
MENAIATMGNNIMSALTGAAQPAAATVDTSRMESVMVEMARSVSSASARQAELHQQQQEQLQSEHAAIMAALDARRAEGNVNTSEISQIAGIMRTQHDTLLAAQQYRSEEAERKFLAMQAEVLNRSSALVPATQQTDNMEVFNSGLMSFIARQDEAQRNYFFDVVSSFMTAVDNMTGKFDGALQRTVNSNDMALSTARSEIGQLSKNVETLARLQERKRQGNVYNVTVHETKSETLNIFNKFDVDNRSVTLIQINNDNRKFTFINNIENRYLTVNVTASLSNNANRFGIDLGNYRNAVINYIAGREATRPTDGALQPAYDYASRRKLMAPPDETEILRRKGPPGTLLLEDKSFTLLREATPEQVAAATGGSSSRPKFDIQTTMSTLDMDYGRIDPDDVRTAISNASTKTRAGSVAGSYRSTG